MSTKESEGSTEESPVKRAFFNFNISKKVSKGIKKGLNLVSLSKKDDNSVRESEIDIGFDFPGTESFIGQNPLAINNNRESEFRFTEYGLEEEENDDDDEYYDEEYGDENDEEGEHEIDEEDSDLFTANNDKELENMFRLFASLQDDDSDTDSRDDNGDNRLSINIINKPVPNIDLSEGIGIVNTKLHHHKLKQTKDLKRINQRRCDNCKETGGCIFYCDLVDEGCDFDLCYDCSRIEQEENGATTNRVSRITNAIQIPSIFDNRPTISKKLEIKDHHTDRINALCLYVPPINYRKSLATILTASDDFTVCIWNLFSGVLVRKLENQHEGPITCIQLFQHPRDENHVSVITSSKDGRIIIWDYNSGKVRNIIKDHMYIYTATGKEEKRVLKDYKNPITGLILHYRIIPPSREVKEERISISVISVDQDSKGYIFDYHSGNVKLNADGTKRIINSNNEGHDDPISGVVLCHWLEEKEIRKGKKSHKINFEEYGIVTVDEQNKLVAWNSSGKKLFDFNTEKGTHEPGQSITSIIALNGKTKADVKIITAAEDSQIFVWSYSQECVQNRLMFGHKEGAITGLAFYDNRTSNAKDIKMLSVGSDGALLVWDYYRAFRREQLGPPFKIPIFSPKSEEKLHPLTGVAIYVNPNDKSEAYVITTTDAGKVMIWELAEDEKIKNEFAKIDDASKKDKKDIASTNYYHKAIKYMGLLQDDNLQEPSNYLDFDVTDIILGHKDYIRRLAYCDIDGTVITGGDDKTAIQWNINNGRVKHKLEGGHHSLIMGIAIIPLAKEKLGQPKYEILTVDMSGLCIAWVNGNIKEEFSICNNIIHGKKEKVGGLCYYHYTSKNVILTVSADLTCCIWEYETKTVIRKLLNGHSYALLGVTVHRFNDKDYIFTCSRDNTIAMWSFQVFERDTKLDVDVCKLLCTFTGHNDEVHQVAAFTYTEGKDKKMAIVSCSDDDTCALWKPLCVTEPFTETLCVTEPFKRFHGHNRPVFSVAMISDSVTLKDSYFVSAGADGKTIVWKCDNEEPHFELKNKNGMHTDYIRRVIFVKGTVGTNTKGNSDQKIITVSDDCTAIIWDVSSFKDKSYAYARQLGHGGGTESASLKGLNLSFAVGETILKEVEITQDKSKKKEAKKDDDNDDDDDYDGGEEEKDEDGVISEKLKNLHIWRRGQYIVGFFYISREKLKTYGHIYYIDLDLHKINYYYKLEIDNDIKNKPEWLKTQFYSLRFKALYYLCRFKDSSKIERSLKKHIEELSKYAVSSKIQISKINDHEFKELTSVPLIDTLGLKELAKTFPIIFKDFICKLTLLDCTSVMFTTQKVQYTFPDIEHIESRPGYDVDGDYCWDEKDLKRIKDKNQRIFEEDPDVSELLSLFVPLPHAGSFEMLEACCHCCQVLNDVSIFDNPVVTSGLRYAWKTYGIYAHLLQFFIYIVFVVILMISTYKFTDWSSGYPKTALSIQILVLVLVGYLITDEILDVNSKRRYVSSEKVKSVSGMQNYIVTLLIETKNIINLTIEHFMNAWNALDLVLHTLTTVGTLYRIIYWTDSNISTSCLAVAILFAWIRLLYFLQAFRQTGPLIAMILHIIIAIVPFLGVLFIVLIGFTSAFYLLSQNDITLPFGTVAGGFLNAFDYMLGNFASDFSGTSNPQLATVLFILYMLFALVVMFNLLIAIMSNAYTEVQANGLSQWRFEQAIIIIELKRKLPLKYLNAVHDTYAKTTNKFYQWYQYQSVKSNNFRNWLQLNRKEPLVGEGCHLHILKRRVTYEANQSKDNISTKIIEDASNKKINAIDEKIIAMEKKLDEIIKALGIKK